SMRVSHNVRPYLGALPLLLCVWTVVRWKHFGGLRWFVVATAVLSLLMVWMSLGEYSYYSQVHRLLPVVGEFRFPSRCLVLLPLAYSIWGALALRDLRRLAATGERPSRLAILAVLATVGVSVLVTASG